MIFTPTASYGHFGRNSYIQEVEVYYEDDKTYKKTNENGIEKIYKSIEFFTWEKLDYVEKIKNEFLEKT